MSRLSRKSAGRRVAALAGGLADDLLKDEQQVFAETAAALANAQARGKRILTDALSTTGDVSALASHTPSQQRLADLHRETLTPCFAAAQGLLTRVVDMTGESIRAELRLCERTLSATYEGLADEAVDGAEDDADVLSRRALMVHGANLDRVVSAFADGLRRQLLLARQYDDTPEQVERRVFSLTPVSRPGTGGRGVWHRSASWVNASTRDASISTMNAFRTDAMRRFNQIGAERG